MCANFGPTHNTSEMKRLVSAVAIAVPIVTAIGAIFVLFYRVDAAEKSINETKIEVASEKVRSTETRESLIRIEEQVKSVRATVESIDQRQRQRFSSGN